MKKLEWKEKDEKITGSYGGITFVIYDGTDKKDCLKYVFLSRFGTCPIETPDFDKEEYEKIFQEMLEKLGDFTISWEKTNDLREMYCGKAPLFKATKKSLGIKCWEIKCWLPQELGDLPYKSDGYEDLFDEKTMKESSKEAEKIALKLTELFK